MLIPLVSLVIFVVVIIILVRCQFHVRISHCIVDLQYMACHYSSQSFEKRGNNIFRICFLCGKCVWICASSFLLLLLLLSYMVKPCSFNNIVNYWLYTIQFGCCCCLIQYIMCLCAKYYINSKQITFHFSQTHERAIRGEKSSELRKKARRFFFKKCRFRE